MFCVEGVGVVLSCVKWLLVMFVMWLVSFSVSSVLCSMLLDRLLCLVSYLYVMGLYFRVVSIVCFDGLFGGVVLIEVGVVVVVV